jgi:hypothetical protein
MEPVPVYAQLNARIMPITRGETYEDPLMEALKSRGFGEVTGGGTMQSESGEIDYCGIDIDLVNLDQSVPFVCDFLTNLGAPKGSSLQYEFQDKTVEVPFGITEGLALYLNGTDLPIEIYERCDVNELYKEINRLLGDRGAIQGHWEGPTETALYLYGDSADEMRQLISAHVANYPLCQRSRLVVIA